VLPRTVTTIWRTELGTKLLNGFDSTTEKSAYFHYLRSYHAAMNCRIKGRFLSRMAPLTGHSASMESEASTPDDWHNVPSFADLADALHRLALKTYPESDYAMKYGDGIRLIRALVGWTFQDVRNLVA
jgi:hypothetical protein